MKISKILIFSLVMVLLMVSLVSAGFLDWFKVLFSGENEVSGYAIAGEENQCDAELNNAIQEIKASLGRLAAVPIDEGVDKGVDEIIEEVVRCEKDKDCKWEEGEKCVNNACVASNDLKDAAGNKVVPEEGEKIKKDEGGVVCRTSKDCDWKNRERCKDGVCVVPQQKANQAKFGLGGLGGGK